MLRWSLFGSVLLWIGCIGSSGPMLGIMSPNVIDARYLRIRNSSQGYVVVRVIAPEVEPLVTPTLPPGAEQIVEMSERFATLCPEWLKVEVAGYARATPEVSPLEDETLVESPFAAFSVELASSLHYGCSADVDWLNLDSIIDIVVMEADEAAGAIGIQAGWLPAQKQAGVHLENPPQPTAPAMFPLNGRIVNVRTEPLANIEIRLPQLDVSVFTDAQGRFRVMRPVGTYVVEPQLPGIEISPAVRNFSHFSSDEVPIEFIALTEQDSFASAGEE